MKMRRAIEQLPVGEVILVLTALCIGAGLALGPEPYIGLVLIAVTVFLGAQLIRKLMRGYAALCAQLEREYLEPEQDNTSRRNADGVGKT